MAADTADMPASVGIAGLGNMGAPMAEALIAAFVPRGIPVLIRARSRSRPPVAGLLDAGATWAESPRALADADVVVVMVPDLPQVDEILDGPDGLLAGVDHETVLVVCSSVSPQGVRALADRAGHESGGRLRVVDAPVSGGVEGAAARTLSLMVGGDEADVARAWPVLEAMGTPVHLGPIGSGQVAKACNQLIVAATMAAVGEAALIADRNGLDVAALLDTLSRGYAGSRLLESKMRNLIERDYRPGGAARYMVKDLGFAASAAAGSVTTTPQLSALVPLYEDLVARGFGDQDLSVVHAYLAGL